MAREKKSSFDSKKRVFNQICWSFNFFCIDKMTIRALYFVYSFLYFYIIARIHVKNKIGISRFIDNKIIFKGNFYSPR